MESDSDSAWGCGITIVVFVGMIIFAALYGVTDEKGARSALSASGLTPVSVGGYGFFACGRDDWFSTKFTARNANGQTVSGTVCEGMIFKGQTIRFDH